MKSEKKQHEPSITGKESFYQGVKDCIPTLLGYLSIGFAAGVVEKTAGLSVAEIILLSLFLYAGSSQFVVAAMVAAGSPVISVIVTVFFVNSRHLLLSAALSPYFRNYSPLKNTLLGAQLTDETFGVAIHRLKDNWRHSDKWMLGLNMTAHLNWVIANAAGAVFGTWIPDPEKYGLNYALPAMFIGLLVLQMTGRKKWFADFTVAAGAVVLFVAFRSVIPGNAAVILSIIFASCIGMVIEQWKSERK